MKIIIISFPDNFSYETDYVIRLFENGLKYFHLRKPGYSRKKIKEFINKIPEKYHNRIIIYDYFDLINEFNLKGIHFNRKTIDRYHEYQYLDCHKSYSAHHPNELIKFDGQFDYMFISPVFNSISKKGYHASVDLDELSRMLKDHNFKSDIIALGGVKYQNIDIIQSAGFKGVALLGEIWNTFFENNNFKVALRAFNDIRNKIGENWPVVLTIAGFDPSSGAGLTSDIKTMEMNRVYGISVCTAITYQNDKSFKSVDWLCIGKIKQQIDILLNRFYVNFIKIGLIENADVMNQVVDYLIDLKSDIKIIWDPILKSGTGFELHKDLCFNNIKEILKKLYLITPNYEEYQKIFKGIDNIQQLIKEENLCSVLIKGGHKTTSDKSDELITSDNTYLIQGDDFNKVDKHGSGCVLSSAIISYLAQEDNLKLACEKGKRYIERFLKSNKTKLGYHFNNNEKD